MNQKEKEVHQRYGIIESPQHKNHIREELPMNIIAQEARKRQAVVKLSKRKGKSFASRIYGVSLSPIIDNCTLEKELFSSNHLKNLNYYGTL